jgi:hypothetical protein
MLLPLSETASVVSVPVVEPNVWSDPLSIDPYTVYPIACGTEDQVKVTGFGMSMAPRAGEIGVATPLGHTGGGAITVEVNDAVLFDVFGSLLDVTLAVFVIVPGVEGEEVRIWIEAVDPAGTDDAEHVTVLPDAEHVKPLPVALPMMTPAGMVSVTVTFVAADGPALLTTIV